MKTIWRNLIGGTVLVGATTLITTQVVSQQSDDQTGADKMQEWLKLAQPGDEHAELAKTVGTWNQEMSHWLYPGAEPTKSTGTAKIRSILGGRFVVENVRGGFEINGQHMPFEGLGIYGFDNLKQKHVFAWVDNMGTMIMSGEGTADTTGKVITYYSEFPVPGGQVSKVKSVDRTVSDNEHVFEMFEKQPDGSWFRNMEIRAKRK